MVVKGDQQRIRTLIKDTLTLLCKNGLSFDSQFCMEALIVFTLDNDDVFHVSINETVKNQLVKLPAPTDNGNYEEEDSREEGQVTSDLDREDSERSVEQSSSRYSPAVRAGRKRPHSSIKPKQEVLESGDGEDPTGPWPPGAGQWPSDSSPLQSPTAQDDSSFQSQGSMEAPAAKQRSLHKESARTNSDNKDVIVIKEELEDDDTSEQDYSYDSQAPYGDVDLAQALGSQPLGPGVSHPADQNLWADTSQQHGANRSATVTSGTGDLSQDPQMGRVIGSVYLTTTPTQHSAFRGPAATWGSQPTKWQCSICQKYLSSKGNLQEHINRHRGLYRYRCGACSMGFHGKGEFELHVQRHERHLNF